MNNIKLKFNDIKEIDEMWYNYIFMYHLIIKNRQYHYYNQ